jgi:hypothetical protein
VIVEAAKSSGELLA